LVAAQHGPVSLAAADPGMSRQRDLADVFIDSPTAADTGRLWFQVLTTVENFP
jgi:hypothetical protein